MWEYSLEEFESMLAVNLRAPFLFIREALPTWSRGRAATS